MSLLDTALAKLTVKPLLIAIDVLVLVVAALSVALAVQHYRHAAVLATAQSQASSEQARADAASTRVDELVAANAGYGDTVATLQAALQHEQSQCATVRQQSAKAVATAKAQAADADAALKTFTMRFASAAAAADCAQALNRLEAACPALRSY